MDECREEQTEWERDKVCEKERGRNSLNGNMLDKTGRENMFGTWKWTWKWTYLLDPTEKLTFYFPFLEKSHYKRHTFDLSIEKVKKVDQISGNKV